MPFNQYLELLPYLALAFGASCLFLFCRLKKRYQRHGEYAGCHQNGQHDGNDPYNPFVHALSLYAEHGGDVLCVSVRLCGGVVGGFALYHRVDFELRLGACRAHHDLIAVVGFHNDHV